MLEAALTAPTIAKTFAERQADIDARRTKYQKQILALNEQVKEIKDYIKELDKQQKELWAEEHGPNMTWFDLWERLAEDDKL